MKRNPHNLPKDITKEHITIQSKLLIHSSPHQCTDTVLHVDSQKHHHSLLPNFFSK